LYLTPAGLRIKENKEVYEGEVTELTPEFTEGEVGTSHWGGGCNNAAAAEQPAVNQEHQQG
jgi:hypothetical protein